MMSIAKDMKMIDVSDWDELVSNTYNKPYDFQQKRGCQDRGAVKFQVPEDTRGDREDVSHNAIPEKVNGEKMCVTFDAWLQRDPSFTETGLENWQIMLFWERNFYPALQDVANDLHKRGLLEAGEYLINIDW